MLRRSARRLVDAARVVAPQVRAAQRSRRRAAFVLRVKRAAAWADSFVDLDIAPDADIHPGVVVEVYPRTRSALVVGPGALIGDKVRLSFRGGTMTVGERTDIRRFGTYHIGGTLRIGSSSMLSTGVCVHCADTVEIGDLTLVSEYSTVTDSAHLRTPPGVPVQHHVGTKPVRIGDNVWIAAHAVITRGVTVGSQAFVGGGAVVVSDVPAGWLAVGVPARAVRELDVEI